MQENNKSYRIKYDQNNNQETKLNIKIDQDFDFLEVLSLKINQEDVYKLYTADYGVVVGRVLANDGFGIPNAKISIFVENQSPNNTSEQGILYPYKSTRDKNADGVRYNLLPSQKINKCHQNVGTLPSKRDILDDNNFLDTFDTYYELTTVTNESGDYMIFGVPTGQQQIHVDIDLSDIGVLSQAPRDMTYQGYDSKKFDSPNKFKKNNNLDNLVQIISQDTTIFVYPFWGDESEGEIAITKKTIDIQYKFEPTCVFMGGVFTDSAKSTISKTCKPTKTSGKMSELMTSQGTIEMLRYTLDNKIERYDINGAALINGDGVWCYQIPMNLDYVITDEYGNLIPSTEPGKGIPTRAKTRFRLTLNDNGSEFTQDKTGIYLIPNNPNNTSEEDYEFNDNCKVTSFTNLMWNKVYSVKNYIPRIQKGVNPKERRFNGIKSVNYHEGNNPIPYNNIWVDINLRFMLMCLITTFFIETVALLNQLIGDIYDITANMVQIPYIVIDTNIIGDNCSEINTANYDYIVVTDNITRLELRNRTSSRHPGKRILFQDQRDCVTHGDVDSCNTKTKILSCIETTLSGENEVVNFDFTNDWLNGSLYAPRFLTKTKLNRKTGEKLVRFCGSYNINNYPNMYLMQTCAPSISEDGVYVGINSTCQENNGKCYTQNAVKQIGNGVIKRDEINDLYYYRPVEFPNPELNSSNDKYLHATEIILLGSLNECDLDGIPKLHQSLPSTSFKLPGDSFEADDSFTGTTTETSPAIQKYMSGIDWGNSYANRENGLFVSIDCMSSTTITKTCVNASRLCELGVDFDEKFTGTTSNGLDLEKLIDGYISIDEMSDGDVRGIFSTLNGNKLKTKLNDYKQEKYDFIYNYPDGFDGKLRATSINLPGLLSDLKSIDYNKFRFGSNWGYYNLSYYTFTENLKYSFPKYSNSFYFYFGLKPGLTAIDVFNNQYFVPCSDIEKDKFEVTLEVLSNEGLCS